MVEIQVAEIRTPIPRIESLKIEPSRVGNLVLYPGTSHLKSNLDSASIDLPPSPFKINQVFLTKTSHPGKRELLKESPGGVKKLIGEVKNLCGEIQEGGHRVDEVH